MHLYIGNYIKIEKTALPLEKWIPILSKFTYINPDYVSAIKYNRNVENIPNTLKSFKEDNNFYYFARGSLKKLTEMIREYNPILIPEVSYKKYNNLSNVVYLQKQTYWTYRKYQKKVIKAIEMIISAKFFNGIICAPAGSGKTILGAAAISILKQPTLIIVPTYDILEQWFKVFTEKYLSLVSIGKLYSGHNNIAHIKTITIGIVDSVLSLIRRKTSKHLHSMFGLIILDECHHCPAPTFTEVLTNFNAKYIIGLTATPFRADKKDFLMFDYVGNIFAQVEESELEEENILLSPIVKFVYTDFYVPSLGGGAGYHQMLESLILNEERNNLIVKLIKKDWAEGHSILVLTIRKKHGKFLLKKLAEQHVPAVYLDGDTPKTKRRQILENMRAGILNILICTNLADEGLDIARLSSIHLVTPTKNERLLIQRIGRIRRVKENKKTIQVIDYVDDKVSIWRYAYYSRKKLYIKHNFRLFDY